MILKHVFIFLLLMVLIPQHSFAELTKRHNIPHDGVINLYSYHFNEFLHIKYLDEQGRWIESAYKKINYILRSRKDNQEINMSKPLVELADHLQDHFKADTIEVISAYRSPEFNKALRDAGRNVGEKSYHIKGMAMDIHIDEVRETTLRDYLLSLRMGGVGYYGPELMVHMDLGPVRQWQGGAFKDNTEIGYFSKGPIKIRTDRLYYRKDAALRISMEGFVPTGGTKLVLQKFYRGHFVKAGDCSFLLAQKRAGATGQVGIVTTVRDVTGAMTSQSPLGRFRLRLQGRGQWQNSNEFYIKGI
ncbi:MAG: YcbK family protein [Deltaproteobacteria bacterium]|nr:YcbK family protein [Deltaproteobacteria bacterium]